jgi:hypothetical protein
MVCLRGSGCSDLSPALGIDADEREGMRARDCRDDPGPVKAQLAIAGIGVSAELGP